MSIRKVDHVFSAEITLFGDLLPDSFTASVERCDLVTHDVAYIVRDIVTCYARMLYCDSFIQIQVMCVCLS